MKQSHIDLARGGSAPEVTHCVVLGEGDTVRIAFLSGTDSGDPVALLSAVTLTRAQLTGFAGMVAAVLDSEDPESSSLN